MRTDRRQFFLAVLSVWIGFFLGITPALAEVLNIAHRGASAYAPEHTLAAYRKALHMGADYLEIDLQMTKDGHLVAMHDNTVNRTTNGTGAVKDLTLLQVKRLDAGSWFNKKYPQYAEDSYAGQKVPLLEEIFQTFGKRAKYYIEIKSPETNPGMEEKLIHLIKRYKLFAGDGRGQPVIIESFSSASLVKIHKLEPRLPLVQLLWFMSPSLLQDFELWRIRSYAIGVAPNYSYLTAAYINKAHSFGLAVHPYTVDDQSDMEKLIGWGADGLITNMPNRLRQVLHLRPVNFDGIGNRVRNARFLESFDPQLAGIAYPAGRNGS